MPFDVDYYLFRSCSYGPFHKSQVPLEENFKVLSWHSGTYAHVYKALG